VSSPIAAYALDPIPHRYRTILAPAAAHVVAVAVVPAAPTPIHVLAFAITLVAVAAALASLLATAVTAAPILLCLEMSPLPFVSRCCSYFRRSLLVSLPPFATTLNPPPR
jgi:hypothetical protein